MYSDVVVVGAGPAGSATALFLARQGYAVTLLDRAAFPRPKPCGEYLTPGAVRLLRDEIGVLPKLIAEGAARLAWETVVPHRGQAFGGATEALACPRTVTDKILRDAAEAAGVQVIEGVNIRRVLWEQGQIVGVADDTSAYRAKIAVGADGTRSLIARALGVVRPVSCLQRVALVAHYAGHYAEEGSGGSGVTMHLPKDGTDACCGVGAVCGPDKTRNVNIVVPLSEAAFIAGRRQAYFEERLRRSFPAVWEQLQGCEPVGPLQSVGCFGHHTARATGPGAVLVGDAATFIHPFTGEGVFFALRGAMLAAEAIGQALARGETSAQALQGYDAARRRELLPHYRLCDAVQSVVHSPGLLGWASARLRRSEPLTALLLQTIGDLARPANLFSLPALRLALSAF